MYFVFGTSASIDEFINTYSYDYLMFTQSNQFTREQWNTLTDDEHVWNVGKEADYNFYALGIDGHADMAGKNTNKKHESHAQRHAHQAHLAQGEAQGAYQ